MRLKGKRRIEMRKLLVCLIVCAVCSPSLATRPFRPKVFANDSFTFVVGFAWADQNDKTLIVRSARKTYMYSRKDLGFKDLEKMSSAGSMWYQQSIGFVTSAKIREGGDADSRCRIFYFRDKKGNEAIIDVNSGRLLTTKQIVEKDKLAKQTAAEAAKLLKSENPRDRQTGAIHLGQLKAKEYRKELTALLKDNASSTVVYGSKKVKTVYYVKDAAAEALKQIDGAK